MNRKELILVILVCMVFLIITELFLRLPVFKPLYADLRMYQSDDLLQYKLIPHFKQEYYHPEYYMDIQLDDEGFRDRNKGDIYALGDSMTFGKGANKSFTDYIDHLGVYNLGVPGYGTDQELDLLKSLPVPRKAIIFFSPVNDFADNINETDFKVYKGGLVFRSTKLTLSKKARVFFRNSKLFLLIGNLFTVNDYTLYDIWVEKLNNDDYDEAKRITDNYFKEFKAYCDENEINCTLVIIPSRDVNVSIENNHNLSIIEFEINRSLYHRFDDHLNAEGHRYVGELLQELI